MLSRGNHRDISLAPPGRSVAYLLCFLNLLVRLISALHFRVAPCLLPPKRKHLTKFVISLISESHRMRVLLTGHLGYIGTILAQLLSDSGHQVVGLDSGLFEQCTFGEPPRQF